LPRYTGREARIAAAIRPLNLKVPALAQTRHTARLVTLTSGSPEVDAAVRRLVQQQLPFAAFSPALAQDYDVIEIRRSWVFNSALWLQ
jgi:hypothetical protein